MQLSPYQQAIINWVKTGTGHATCNAVAGSGKSTTLRLAAIALFESGVRPSNIKICVFGKANAQDLIAKFGKAWEGSISTLHSAGWSLLKTHLQIKKPQGLIKPNKYKAIAQDLGLLSKRGSEGELRRNHVLTQERDFTTLLDLVRLTNQTPTPETVRDICLHFEIAEIRDFAATATSVAQVLRIGENEANQGERFDFCDQIWLPVKWGLKPSQPYKFVLIDECQDLNAAQLELALSLASHDGRILAVGDPRQAIMGFAGADNRSYYKIVERLKAVELPLSICYRCPSSVINLVKSNFPEIPIEAGPTAPVGKIEAIAERDLWDTEFDGFAHVPKACNLTEGDMVISRKTAPLVSLCIKLIARGIAATVKGKAIGEQIKNDLEEIAKIPGFKFSEFNDAVNLYRATKRERYHGLDNEEQLIEQLNDKLEALTTIYKSQPQATAIAHLADYIDSLFSDEHSPITLSTCHRAKGLEADRVFVVKPEDMPMVWRNQQDWQFEQEQNLLYVAMTRTKSELFVVGYASWLNPEQPTVNDNSELANVDSEPEEIPFPHHLETVKELAEEKPETITLHPTVNLDENLLSPLQQELITNPLRSDRAIAAICGVTAPTVGKWRKRLLQQGLIDCNGKRVDRNGRKLNTTNIGKPQRSLTERVREMVKETAPTQAELKDLIAWLTEQVN